MVDSRLVEYIKMSKKRGASEESLKRKLIEQGHPPAAVEEAFKESDKKSLTKAYLFIIAGVVITLLFVFAVFNQGKKIGIPEKPTIPEKKTQTPQITYTQEAQLLILNKTLNQKYTNSKIKNYGMVVYEKEPVLRAEVDLGFIDVCGQKIKADSAVFVVQDGKVVPTPINEIQNKARKYGNIIPEVNSETNKTEVKKISTKAPYNCRSASDCSVCDLNNVYMILVKLNSTYEKYVNDSASNEQVAGALVNLAKQQQPKELSPEEKAKIEELKKQYAQQGNNNATQLYPTGNVKIDYNRFLIDEVGNFIYKIEGFDSNGGISFLGGDLIKS